MLDSGQKRPRNANQLTELIVDIALGEVEDVDNNQKENDPAMVALKSKGGQKKGKVRAASYS